MSKEELNNAAMQIILHAGNCRNLLKEALIEGEGEADTHRIDQKWKEAKAEITEAHKLQTDMIQATIEEDELQTTLLFTHAQDTLMTIYAEMDLAEHLLRLMVKVNRGLKNANK